MDFLKVTKISFYSLFATIFFIVGLYSFIETLDYWTPEFLDLKYDHLLQNAMPGVNEKSWYGTELEFIFVILP